MKMSKLVGRRMKETPKDAKTISHIFMIRGGYMRQLSTGIYTMLPLGKRVQDKIERIIKEEMDAIDGQEITMPVVNPSDIWEESGRYQSIGDELLRFKDRNEKPMVLAMTHEEAVCHMARTELTSYKQLPVMVYQIQTKYRDEARPRAGLIRVREFKMKDAYSFHESQKCLEAYYAKVHQAYENIFRRIGLTDCISIESDTGMIGGSKAHEFMAISECGEDTLFVSPCGKYKANREIATSQLPFTHQPCDAMEMIHTPGQKSIEDLATFLNVPTSQTGKCVCYVDGEGTLYMAMIRGDIEINEIKLKKAVGRADLQFANDAEIERAGAVAGYMSPIGITDPKVVMVFDESVTQSAPLFIGANQKEYHFKNFDYQRDFMDKDKARVADIRIVRAGDPCPMTGAPLIEKRGIEVGNIFQLGTKYSQKMGVNYLDRNGKSHPIVMGCYGIGCGRSVASVIEQNHDEYGPIWPISISPYHVHICALNPDKEGVGEACEKLYADCNAQNIEALYDDRGEKAGFMFNDADLIGIPFRIIVSPKTLAEGKVEFKRRGQKDPELLDLNEVVERLQKMIADAMITYK